MLSGKEKPTPYPIVGTQKVAYSKKAAIYPNNGRNI
jgi:hypothetical protein